MTTESGCFCHPTALIEENVAIGDRTRVWDHVHIRTGTKIGRDCIIGGKTYVAYGVTIGDLVKINSFVYICHGVEVERGVMISAGTIFTNDRFPRATTPDLQRLRSSEPDEETGRTVVREGASIGAGAIIGNPLEVGRFAMVGMGSVVSRSVPDFHLVVGAPARSVGWVCRCGTPMVRFPPNTQPTDRRARCPSCGRSYAIAGGVVTENTDQSEV